MSLSRLRPGDAGRIQALAVTAGGQAPQTPEVPIMAEAALPGFPAAPWWGKVGPAGMPPAALARPSAALKQAPEAPQAVQHRSENGCRAGFMDPAAFEAFVRARNLKWSRVIEAVGLKVN